MVQPMSEAQIELTIQQIIEIYGISRNTFQRWRDAVYSGVGDPPYTKDELIIIFENAQKLTSKAIGASRHKNTQKLANILRSLNDSTIQD
jgi:hypothetical protein